jgi:hypothetical protein
VFYRYTQNNSGGVWVGAPHVVVEAANLDEAEAIAKGAGVYFDGVAAELDCECCGDRWFRGADEYATREEALASLAPYAKVEGELPEHQLLERAPVEAS